MFRRLHESAAPVTVFVDGTAVRASEGDSVSTALLCAGKSAIRISAVGGTPRAPFCSMGVCFDCLLTIDGEGNQQACLTAVKEGMRIVTGDGRRDLRAEVGL